MARVVVRREVIESGELSTVPQAQLKAALRGLESAPLRGKALVRELAGCRSIRIGGSENRLIYRVLAGDVVEVLAVGRRRDEEVHSIARRRL